MLYAIRISESYLPMGCKWPRYNRYWLQKDGTISKENGLDVALYPREYEAIKDIKKYKDKLDERKWELIPTYSG